MKNISTLILVLLILTSPVFSQTRGKKGNAVAAESDEQVIRGLEQQYADALKRRDITVLGRLFAEDFISRPTPERSFNKTERLAAIKSDDVSFEVVGVEDVNVRLYKESAVVLGRITSQGKRKAADFSDNSAYIHVYVKKDGRWQMVASQLSPCAPQL